MSLFIRHSPKVCKVKSLRSVYNGVEVLVHFSTMNIKIWRSELKRLYGKSKITEKLMEKCIVFVPQKQKFFPYIKSDLSSQRNDCQSNDWVEIKANNQLSDNECASLISYRVHTYIRSEFRHFSNFSGPRKPFFTPTFGCVILHDESILKKYNFTITASVLQYIQESKHKSLRGKMDKVHSQIYLSYYFFQSLVPNLNQWAISRPFFKLLRLKILIMKKIYPFFCRNIQTPNHWGI